MAINEDMEYGIDLMIHEKQMGVILKYLFFSFAQRWLGN